MLKQPLTTILPAFIAILLLLSSCDSYYKITEQTTKSAAEGQELKADDFASNLSVWSDNHRDTAFFVTSLSIRNVMEGKHLKMMSLTMQVNDYPADKRKYTLQKIVAFKRALNNNVQHPVVEIDSAFQNGKYVMLTAGYDYDFSYYFFANGHKHVAHKVQITTEAIVDDEGIKKTAARNVIFEKHNHFNPGGD
jgi:hypothetical protein